MRSSFLGRRRVPPLVLVLVLALLVGAFAVTAGATTAQQVPGFDGTTIKVAGYGLTGLPSVPYGAQARIKQFNDGNEIKGVKIEFVDYADDKGDNATALSEVRRLVSQEGVFALVPEISLNTPKEYINQQKVPTFGGGFTGAYCSTKPVTTEWFFGFQGCQVTDQPTVTPDTEANVLKYVQQATGKAHPTVAQLSADDQVGHVANELFKAQYLGNKGWGKLVYNEAAYPPPSQPVGDFSPYVQALLKADNGKQPDFIRCSPVECIAIYAQLRAAGYTGEFEHNIYSDGFVKAYKDTVVAIPHHNLSETGNPALEKLKTNLAAVKPGQTLDSGVMYGYLTTDMFISALKKAAAKGKSNITRDSVQKAAATQTWQIKDLAGPTQFPASTVKATPMCREIVKSDGTKWVTVIPYSCNTKAYKVK